MTQPSQAALAILGEIDLETGVTQMHRHRLAENGIVFDHEDACHG